jgi:HPt (histidine-containing phosphotransfer) domain-containing protein
MFILPLPTSPGEHGADDHSAGMMAKARQLFPFSIHKSANGFIAAALLIQLFSIAGVMPMQVWTAEPGYAVTVCLGLFALSACILFSLRNLLTAGPQEPRQEQSGDGPKPVSTPEISNRVPSVDPQMPRALVIQDTLTIQAIVEKSLAKSGIPCRCVTDESAAREALGGNAYDIAIADAAWLASRRSLDIRAFLREKGIPLLVLAETESEAAEVAADATIAMPIVPRDLARKAAELIAARAARASSQARSAPHREVPQLEAEPLDSRALGDLESLGGRDFVRDIVAQFVADAASVLASLSAAIASRDQKAFREQAHALRSCAANVGAQNVYRMCLAWRDLDAQEIAASGSQCMQMLEEEFERVRGALAPMLHPHHGGAGPDSKAA